MFGIKEVFRIPSEELRWDEAFVCVKYSRCPFPDTAVGPTAVFRYASGSTLQMLSRAARTERHGLTGQDASF